jgi:hypothetical protein
MVSSYSSIYNALTEHTVWQLAICTFLVVRLGLLAGILLFGGSLGYLCCITTVSHGYTGQYIDPMVEYLGGFTGRVRASGSSPDLEASLLDAAMVAVGFGRHRSMFSWWTAAKGRKGSRGGRKDKRKTH